MLGHPFLAHFIHLESGCFRGGGPVSDEGGGHPHSQDGPFTFGNLPREHAVLIEATRNIQNIFFLHKQRRIVHLRLFLPHVSIPVGERGGVHFGQCFLAVPFHPRDRTQVYFGQSCSRLNIVQGEPKLSCRGLGEGYGDRCVGFEPHVEGRVGSINLELGNRFKITVLLFCIQHRVGVEGRLRDL